MTTKNALMTAAILKYACGLIVAIAAVSGVVGWFS